MDISCKVGLYHLYTKLWGPYKWPKNIFVSLGLFHSTYRSYFIPVITGFWAHLVCSFAMMTTISRDLAKMNWILWVTVGWVRET